MRERTFVRVPSSRRLTALFAGDTPDKVHNLRRMGSSRDVTAAIRLARPLTLLVCHSLSQDSSAGFRLRSVSLPRRFFSSRGCAPWLRAPVQSLGSSYVIIQDHVPS